MTMSDEQDAAQVQLYANAIGEELKHIVGGRILAPRHARPTIVCICGSTRFYEEWQKAMYRETMAGRIYLAVGFYPGNPEVHGEGVGCSPEQKLRLDELHKRKIDLADELLVLCPGGYIGESTRSEIDYADAHQKRVRYYDSQQGGEFLITDHFTLPIPINFCDVQISLSSEGGDPSANAEA